MTPPNFFYVDSIQNGSAQNKSVYTRIVFIIMLWEVGGVAGGPRKHSTFFLCLYDIKTLFIYLLLQSLPKWSAYMKAPFQKNKNISPTQTYRISDLHGYHK